MLRNLLVCLLVASCAPTRTLTGPLKSDPLPAKYHLAPNRHPVMGCRTECGLNAPFSTNCDALAEIEKEAIASYALHAHLNPDEMCRALNGWTVFVYPGADAKGMWYYAPKSENIFGLCRGPDKQIFIGMDVWANSALVHEFGHIWDGAIFKLKGDHPHWTGKGFCAAINSVSELKDECDWVEYNN